MRATDDEYVEIILRRIQVCKAYQPHFGHGAAGSLSLESFQHVYGADPFYAWFGLDNPLVYAAHKAAGGITSVYRQLGIGCEELVRRILQDQLDLSPSQVMWSYTLSKPDGASRRVSLDGRIELGDIRDPRRRARVATWLDAAAKSLGIEASVAAALRGMVLEVRQGYKSKDSKRQNADIANAAMAYSQGYLPVVLVLSTQIDTDIVYRYQMQRWLILRGYINGSATASTYSFMRETLGYDLAEFLDRNAMRLRTEMRIVLETLLSP
ncbi:MAG: hypothetical protein IT323_01780 [Anaerolineae bacterium]|nr:hypothetical protein [Anaerolineae bacterium]